MAGWKPHACPRLPAPRAHQGLVALIVSPHVKSHHIILLLEVLELVPPREPGLWEAVDEDHDGLGRSGGGWTCTNRVQPDAVCHQPAVMQAGDEIPGGGI